MSEMNDGMTHQTSGRQYCRAIRINTPSDHAGIVVDADGFEAAKISVRTSEFSGQWMNVPRGGYVLERDSQVVNVLSEADFYQMWEPIDAPESAVGPATRDALKVIEYKLRSNMDLIAANGTVFVSVEIDDPKAFLAELEANA
jgi:hypothetical protein